MPRHTPALLFLLLVVVGFSLWFFFKPDPFGDALKEREIATRALAQHLARSQPGKRALIVSNPFTQSKEIAKATVEMEQAGLRGLREGFGKSVTVAAVAFPELKPEARDNPRALLAGVETTTPLSYLVAPEAFDRLVKQHPDCEIVVSLIGLPADLGRCESWRAPGPPAFALLLPDLRIIGDEAAVRSVLKSGKLLAFVSAKPREAGASSSPDLGAEFEKRFLLVTPENADQLARRYPGMF